MSLTAVAVSGPLQLAALLAIAAGLVSVASPCCLPLVPSYLAHLAGPVAKLPTSEAGTGPVIGRWQVTGAALLFVAGFTAVFTTATVAALVLTEALLANEGLLQRIGAQ